MVDKLARVRLTIEEDTTAPPDPSRLYRFEIASVIADTAMLVSSPDPAATLDELVEA